MIDGKEKKRKLDPNSISVVLLNTQRLIEKKPTFAIVGANLDEFQKIMSAECKLEDGKHSPHYVGKPR